jgi:Eco29kI restriction endonuclease
MADGRWRVAYGTSAEFKLSITRALADQLAQTLEPLSPAPLDEESLEGIEERPGVYELFLREDRVYVGKASASLRERLGQHARKLSGRSGLDPFDVTFVCVYVDEDLDAAAPEKLLIKKYRSVGGAKWNTNGFGNKDPGRRRDESMVKASHFDASYPIDLGATVPLPWRSLWSLELLLQKIKSCLPYNFRFQNDEPARRAYKAVEFSLPSELASVKDLVSHVIDHLPAGWQATALPGYLILYEEAREYESALMRWRRDPDGRVVEKPGLRHFASGDPEIDGSDDTAD